MANQGAKKRKEENERRIRLLQQLIGGANVAFILVRLVAFYSSTSWKIWLAFALSSFAYYYCYQAIAYAAAPTFDERGELMDGGSDLSIGGLLGYYHDIIYVLAFVQIGSILSDKFWYFMLVIPAFALYKAWTGIIYPYFLAPSPEYVEDEKTRKKREKLERQQKRAEKFSNRR
ncbi:hypothetical protein KFL_003900070 [Klebsormidium nitens]|uniref:Transmembrane protein 208 n=1 Tax=Klebsormidium nitens TaxID=105231 RepID=A0A1Y1IGX8_KLENI|nr:hypothetical protein KFL_003900070 [Klebsormidium nitens]|eukprot:GAQ87967.1 hypothetical protein KFL_003900070 [Klebsormidium nitens]